MEDQQSHPGDLTTEAAPTPRRRGRLFRRRPAAEQAVPPDAEAAVEPDDKKTPVGKAARTAKNEPRQADSPEPDETAVDEPDEAVVDEPDEPILVPHRPAGKRLVGAAIVASVLFVGGGAFAGAMVQPYLSQRALDDVKLDVARAATSAITALWSYTPNDMATLADRASRYLAGDFGNEYRKYIDAIVEPNKQAKVTNTTEVKGVAVESLSSTGTPARAPSEATAIVYTNSVSTSPVTKNIPSLRYLSYRLTMHRHGSDWLISNMSTVTSFDLTPQL